jgi:hypothetical protein
MIANEFFPGRNCPVKVSPLEAVRFAIPSFSQGPSPSAVTGARNQAKLPTYTPTSSDIELSGPNDGNLYEDTPAELAIR